MDEKICSKYVLVSFDEISRVTEGIEIMHWQEFIRQLPTWMSRL
jgi:hypothetical protein